MSERHCKETRAKAEHNYLSVITGSICNSIQLGIVFFFLISKDSKVNFVLEEL